MRNKATAAAWASVWGVIAGLSVTAASARAEEAAVDPLMEGIEPPALRTVRVEEIVVTGSRLRAVDAEGPSPVTVFDRQAIDGLGVSSVTELLKFIPQQAYWRGEDYWANGAQFVELRGLGADTTLVLINGRRTVPSAANVSANAFDLNTIPLAAVERVEVLSDAASAVYGADAVGGVVNIILKEDVEGTVLDLHYGAAQGGARERRASISTGWSGDRGHAVLVLDALEKEALLGAARARSRDQDFRRFGSFDYRSLNAHPGNISSLTGENLPGLSSPVAAVPAGSTGVGLTPADFEATAGEQRMDSLSKFSAIVPEAQRYSAAVFAELDLAPHVSLFGELLYADRSNDGQFSPPSLSGATVPATNAFNPFGVDVAVNYRFAGLSPRRMRSEAELLRGVAGLHGSLGTWEWEASVLKTREEASSWTANTLDFARVEQALAASDPAEALNVFADGPGGSVQLLGSLIAEPAISRFASEGTQGSAFVRGPAVKVPAGEVQVVLGAEWRQEDMLFDDYVRLSEGRSASAVFAEIGLPLIDASMQIPAAHSLSLQLAGRHDQYSDFGNTFNPQFGLVWSPLDDLVLRLSHGTSFRPPSLFELYVPRVVIPLHVTDPRRNNEVIEATAISGGNPQLNPVQGESLTAGFVFTPAALAGLRLSASYWEITLDERVAFFSQQLVLANEARYPERVVRADPSPADATQGLPGRILSVDISRINFGRVDTSGVDLDLSYGFDTGIGRWTSRIAATWVRDYQTVDVPDSAPVDRLGLASFFGTIPEWRAVASLGWMWRGLELTATGRFVSPYDDADPFTDLATGGRVPAQTLLDLQASWDADGFAALGSSWLRGLKLTAGFTNVLDEEPNFAQIGGSSGYDLSQGDLRQRFGYVNLSKRF